MAQRGRGAVASILEGLVDEFPEPGPDSGDDKDSSTQSSQGKAISDGNESLIHIDQSATSHNESMGSMNQKYQQDNRSKRLSKKEISQHGGPCSDDVLSALADERQRRSIYIRADLLERVTRLAYWEREKFNQLMDDAIEMLLGKREAESSQMMHPETKEVLTKGPGEPWPPAAGKLPSGRY